MPTRRAMLVAVVLDGLHALSMGAVAATAPTRRRVALFGALTGLSSFAGGMPAAVGRHL